MFLSFSRWLRSASSCPRAGQGRRPQPHGRPVVPRRSFVPVLELLEDRTVPDTLTVQSNLDLGVGSLRHTIAAAKNGDTILFAPTVQAITLTSGALVLDKNLEIRGPSASQLSISGNDASRVFQVGSGVRVELAGLTITRGQANKDSPVFPSVGGGILNGGTLILTGVVVSANQALGAASASPFGTPGNALGGGLVNFGTLTITASAFTGNLARGANGVTATAAASIAVGGGLANLGAAAITTISNTTFDRNEAIGGNNNMGATSARASVGVAVGAGIYNNGTLTVTNSQFSSNQALGGHNNVGGSAGGTVGGGLGAGIFNAVTLTVTGSRFDSNQALGGHNNRASHSASDPGTGAGGGIFNNLGTAAISASTFTGNLAQAGNGNQGGTWPGLAYGGGVTSGSSAGSTASPTLTVSNSTVEHNQVIGGNGNQGGSTSFVGVAYGAGIDVYTGTATISNSTIAYNRAIGGSNNLGGNSVETLGGNGQGRGGGVFSIRVPTIDQPTSVTVSDCTIAHNQAVGGTNGLGGNGSNGEGGGLANLHGATLTVRRSTVKGNQAVGAAGGGHGQGGGIYNLASTLTVSDSTLSANQALGGDSGPGGNGGHGLGGGLFVGGGTASVSTSALRANQAVGGDGGQGGNGFGGGLYVAAGSVSVSASEITANAAIAGSRNGGGALGSGRNGGLLPPAGGRIGGMGGGVYSLGTLVVDTLTVIASNRASTSNDDLFT
ncbi:MAG: hypothetical protein L0Z62_05730 [Gemmataceae bacterium]|nr:hypothetical protein [Gemmataceae bacterium]